MSTRKQEIIDRIHAIIRPKDERPEIAVFRDSNCAYPYEEGRVKIHAPVMHAPDGSFFHGEILLTRAECLRIPAKKYLFVIHSSLLHKR